MPGPLVVGLVGAGSGFGAVLRWGAGLLLGPGWVELWLVNLLGAALLGLCAGALTGRRHEEWLLPLLGPGLLGGFTTFSAVMVLALDQGVLRGPVPGSAAVGSVLLLTALGALLCALGLRLGRSLPRAEPSPGHPGGTGGAR